MCEEEHLLLVCASDHFIGDQQKFYSALQNALQLAEENKIVTFGIVPSSANPNYGYIKTGQKFGNGFKIDRFIEKPK